MYLPVQDADLPAIATLMNRAYRGSGGDAGWNTEDGHLAGDRTTVALLRAEIAAKPAGSLLRWVEADVAGFEGCVWLEPLGEGVWYLGSLTVDPGRQNGGLGRRLLAAAEDWARGQGATRIRMTVINLRESVIAWYLRRGYALTGETEPFPYGDDRFGRPLRDDLCFVLLEKTLSDS